MEPRANTHTCPECEDEYTGYVSYLDRSGTCADCGKTYPETATNTGAWPARSGDWARDSGHDPLDVPIPVVSMPKRPQENSDSYVVLGAEENGYMVADAETMDTIAGPSKNLKYIRAVARHLNTTERMPTKPEPTHACPTCRESGNPDVWKRLPTETCPECGASGTPLPWATRTEHEEEDRMTNETAPVETATNIVIHFSTPHDTPEEVASRVIDAINSFARTDARTEPEPEPTDNTVAENDQWASEIWRVLVDIGDTAAHMHDENAMPRLPLNAVRMVQSRALAIQNRRTGKNVGSSDDERRWWREIAALAADQIITIDV